MSRVLVVEDDPAMSVALRDGFDVEKHFVEMANDGEEGFRLASRGDHDVVILDVMLPRKSGLDVCKELRRSGVRRKRSMNLGRQFTGRHQHEPSRASRSAAIAPHGEALDHRQSESGGFSCARLSTGQEVGSS